MTSIPYNTAIKGAGNVAAQCAYDVIFPAISAAIDATHALASIPLLKAWSNSGLDTITAADSGPFWSTSPTYDVGTGSTFLGSALRAICTNGGAAGSNWAANANQTGGTSDPAAGKGRCLRGNVDYLPLQAAGSNLLGDNNTSLVNRVMFNLAMAVHTATSAVTAALNAYLAIEYTYVDTDPGCVLRGNTNASGEPSATSITSLDHTHMKSIFGDDPDLVSSGGDRVLRHAEAAVSASLSLPYMTKPTSGFKYSDKAVATAA